MVPSPPVNKMLVSHKLISQNALHSGQMREGLGLVTCSLRADCLELVGSHIQSPQLHHCTYNRLQKVKTQLNLN